MALVVETPALVVMELVEEALALVLMALVEGSQSMIAPKSTLFLIGDVPFQLMISVLSLRTKIE